MFLRSSLLHSSSLFLLTMASTYDDSKEFKGDDMKVEVATEERASLEASGSWFMEEKRLIRKLDRRILPIACLLYLFACEHLHP